VVGLSRIVLVRREVNAASSFVTATAHDDVQTQQPRLPPSSDLI
jgi:hypothetical protein